MVILAVMALVPIVLGIVVLVVLVGFTRSGKAQQPGWQQVPARATDNPAMAQSVGQGVWNAQILGGGFIGAMGGTLNSTFGTFHLDRGALSFVPDGATAPSWSTPCSQLGVRFSGVFAPAAVTLRGPMGEVRCKVSVEHINRVTRNSFKSMREGRHAQAFVSALAANGARPG